MGERESTTLNSFKQSSVIRRPPISHNKTHRVRFQCIVVSRLGDTIAITSLNHKANALYGMDLKIATAKSDTERMACCRPQLTREMLSMCPTHHTRNSLILHKLNYTVNLP